jgi:hypothetical protein
LHPTHQGRKDEGQQDRYRQRSEYRLGEVQDADNEHANCKQQEKSLQFCLIFQRNHGSPQPLV